MIFVFAFVTFIYIYIYIYIYINLKKSCIKLGIDLYGRGEIQIFNTEWSTSDKDLDFSPVIFLNDLSFVESFPTLDFDLYGAVYNR